MVAVNMIFLQQPSRVKVMSSCQYAHFTEEEIKICIFNFYYTGRLRMRIRITPARASQGSVHN